METARAAAETIAAEGDIPERVVLSARERAEDMRARAEKEEPEAARRLRTKGAARAPPPPPGRGRRRRPGRGFGAPAADPLSAADPRALFMLRLDEMLEYYACQRVEQNVKVSIEVNGARVPGEGEVKMMSRMGNVAAACRHRRRGRTRWWGPTRPQAALHRRGGGLLRLQQRGAPAGQTATWTACSPSARASSARPCGNCRGWRSALRGAQRDLLLCFMTGNDTKPCGPVLARPLVAGVPRAARAAMRDRPIVREDRTIDRGAPPAGRDAARLGVVTRASSAAELAAAEALDSDAALAALPPPADGRRPGGAAARGQEAVEEEEEGAAAAASAARASAHACSPRTRAMAVEAMADGGGMGALNRMLQSHGAPVVTKADCTHAAGRRAVYVLHAPQRRAGLTTETIETLGPQVLQGRGEGGRGGGPVLRLQSAEALAGAQSEADDAAAGGADAQFVAGQVVGAALEAVAAFSDASAFGDGSDGGADGAAAPTAALPAAGAVGGSPAAAGAPTARARPRGWWRRTRTASRGRWACTWTASAATTAGRTRSRARPPPRSCCGTSTSCRRAPSPWTRRPPPRARRAGIPARCSRTRRPWPCCRARGGPTCPRRCGRSWTAPAPPAPCTTATCASSATACARR